MILRFRPVLRGVPFALALVALARRAPCQDCSFPTYPLQQTMRQPDGRAVELFFRGGARNLFARGRRSRERDLVDAGVGRQGSASGLASSRNHIQYAGGHAGLGRQSRQVQNRAAGFL